MPRLWSETIDTHRQAVRDAVLTSTAAQVAEHGVRAVTMSQIAERAGIGRATLYKYFPDVDAILAAWHERHVADHLEQLCEVVHRGGDPVVRLQAVLTAYASSQRHAAELAALHQGEHIDRAQQRLVDFIGDLLAEGVAAGALRDDVPAQELAAYCLSALSAARFSSSRAALKRLVEVTVSGLRAAR
jgi:AcrR family transcriptional regulator